MPLDFVGASVASWRQARASVRWPCRFEIFTPQALPRGSKLLLDVAHNAPAIDALVASVVAAFPPPGRFVVVFGANFDKDGGEARIAARNDDVFGEEVPIVNSQRPELIPEDLRQELHIRVDKLSVVYRRWLGDLGITGAAANQGG